MSCVRPATHPALHLVLVATLLEHLGSNVCSKFHKNRSILKLILLNRDIQTPNVSATLYANFCLNQSIYWDARLIRNWPVFFVPDKLVNSMLFENSFGFLKIGVFWKVFIFFFLISKKGFFKKVKIFLISLQKGVLFPSKISWKGVKFYMLKHTCVLLFPIRVTTGHLVCCPSLTIIPICQWTQVSPEYTIDV